MPRHRPILPKLVAAAAFLAALACTSCRLPDTLTAGMFSDAPDRSHPAAADCERCHQEVYREWKGSLHARAFRHPAFQAASASGRAEGCVGCHAPSPLTEGEAPTARTERLDEGVTCIACHLSPAQGDAPRTMRGPVSRTSPIGIHPIVEADPFYLSSELCGTCHGQALLEWRSAPPPPDGSEAPTCQSCHMPAVRRKVESVHDEHAYSALFVALGDEADLRRHTFDVPEVSGDEIGLTARLTELGGVLEVSVLNRLPHDLPTGSFGERTIRLRVHWPGGELTRTRSRRTDGALGTGETWLESFAISGVDPRDLKVALERREHRSRDWSVLRSVPVGPERP